MMSFSEPSPALLQVRQIQKTLAMVHHFGQAKQLKRAGDQMQRTESTGAGGRRQAILNGFGFIPECPGTV
jgi:hypothetical protein